jgi:hypothetical protein
MELSDALIKVPQREVSGRPKWEWGEWGRAKITS